MSDTTSRPPEVKVFRYAERKDGLWEMWFEMHSIGADGVERMENRGGSVTVFKHDLDACIESVKEQGIPVQSITPAGKASEPEPRVRKGKTRGSRGPTPSTTRRG